MLACAAMLISWLTVYVPVGTFPEPMTVEEVVPVAGPPGTPPVRVSHVRFVSDSGAMTIDVTVFDGEPPYPGGPMAIADTEQVAVAGEALAVNWTSMFMGRAEEVAVTYPADPAGVGSAMVVVRGTDFAGALEIIPRLLGGC
ncbi:MAG: hypothetical protein KIS68_05745 [Bauldia sp.]|nr:hypothetical protein [Bauldia sp.]